MSLTKLTKAPKFDRSQPHGTLYGSGDGSLGSFVQNGHYYRGDGEYVGTDPASAKVAFSPSVTVTSQPGARTVTIEEADELLKDVRAKELMDLGLDTLAAMVRTANGPQYSGDNAHKLYTGWLLKHTDPGV